MAEKMIEISSLTKKYGSFTAVDNLTLTIEKGEVFGLLGPDGAGKTTAILMLLGLTEPTGGNASIAGIDCTQNPLKVRNIVGYLPDNMDFCPDMTGRENLRMTGKRKGLTGSSLEARINELLDRVGMSHSAEQNTSSYSKAMKQRLGFADLLMTDPEVLIMDEPTDGIDPEGMRELSCLIRELSKTDGKTILISSKHLYQLQHICDRVGIFAHGKLIACGNIHELSGQLQQGIGFHIEVGARPEGEQLLALMKNIDGVNSVEQSEHGVLVHSHKDVCEAIVNSLLREKFELTHLRQPANDLNEIYSRYFDHRDE